MIEFSGRLNNTLWMDSKDFISRSNTFLISFSSTFHGIGGRTRLKSRTGNVVHKELHLKNKALVCSIYLGVGRRVYGAIFHLEDCWLSFASLILCFWSLSRSMKLQLSGLASTAANFLKSRVSGDGLIYLEHERRDVCK